LPSLINRKKEKWHKPGLSLHKKVSLICAIKFITALYIRECLSWYTPSTHDERQEKQYDKNEEQDLGDTCSACRNATEPEYSRNNGDY
jgi:hypothetical protein